MRHLSLHVLSFRMLRVTLSLLLILVLPACITNQVVKRDEQYGGIFEVQVKDGVTYQDVLDSLKTVSEGMNFVNPANFPIADHIKARGIDPRGVKEVHSYCNLSLGTEIFLDHPEFLVFAPCRVAIYEKQSKLYIGLARPTFDLKNIKNPTPRAQKAAQELEDALILLVTKASKGEI